MRSHQFLKAASLLFLLASPAAASGRKAPRLEFTVEPSTVTAGRTLAVWCRASKPLKNATLRFGDREALFYPAGEMTWRALLGVSSLETPGVKQALFQADLSRRVFRSSFTFHVAAGTYPVSRVAITGDKDTLIASGQLEKDAQVLAGVYSRPLLDQRLWDGYFILPTTGIVSSVFGARRAYGNRSTLNAHTGTDIANEVGTLIVAPNRGRVVFAGWLDAFGNSVMLDHGQGVFSYYLHMKEILAPKDSVVERGTPLGLMGAEGLVTGPHLHWSFVVAGERVDPFEWTEREFR
jgi:murein DD-endopeptidase MepM/ murein hydrolase activator NlpD